MPTGEISPIACANDFALGDWLIQPTAGRICRGETLIRLRPQLVDLLACLAGRAGRTVSKREILDAVWPGLHIADSGLARCVAELRQALGDVAQEPRYIETIRKRGYRLVAPVRWLPRATEAEGPGGDPGRAAPEPLVEASSPRPATPWPVSAEARIYSLRIDSIRRSGTSQMRATRT
jgi:DNA-binding winged helix-turn-helix (wHTH) protein